MKKLLTVLLAISLLLALTGCCSHEWYAATCEAPKTCSKCGETEGEALGHSWVDVTCTAPKTCSVCHVQEGSALGHDWIDATTETPMTCATCAITEGERIITDPRFTTAATKDLYSKWSIQASTRNDWLTDMVIPVNLELQLDYEFFNDGTVRVDFTGLNVDAFMTAFGETMADTLYDQFAESNISKEKADEMMRAQYSMSVAEYAQTAVQGLDLAKLLTESGFTGVYYVEDGRLFIANDWSSEMSDCQVTVDGDKLTMDTDLHGFFEGAITLSRVAE